MAGGQRDKNETQAAQTADEASHTPEQASRRKLMGAGASLALGGFLPAGMAGAAAAPAGAPKPNAVAPADVLKRLQEGNARYAANKPNERDFSAERAARATAQYPVAAILSCADSRVVPDLVFDQEPGDLFVCRVAGNIVTTDLLASIEYGVEFLGAVLIVVMGHSSCGAVDAAIKVVKDDAKLPGHLPELMRAIKPAVLIAQKKTSGTLLDNSIVENVRRQVAALKRATPIISRDYASKKIDIVGGVYDIATGKVTMI
jgi:carbonic anhydrase